MYFGVKVLGICDLFVWMMRTKIVSLNSINYFVARLMIFCLFCEIVKC